jgi:hypothetical protein
VQVVDGQANAVLGPFLQYRGHPLLQGLDFTGVLWSGGLPSKQLRTSETPLLMAGSTVLLSEQILGRERHFTLYINAKKSSLVDHPAWPAFINNLILMRRNALPGCRQTTVLSSQSCQLMLPPGHQAVTISRDDGHSTLLQADRDGVVVIPPSDHIGRLRVTLSDSNEVWLTIQVIACDARMADLRQASSTIAGSDQEHRGEVERARSMLEHLLPIMLAALCAGLGWLAFTREEGRAP